LIEHSSKEIEVAEICIKMSSTKPQVHARQVDQKIKIPKCKRDFSSPKEKCKFMLYFLSLVIILFNITTFMLNR